MIYRSKEITPEQSSLLERPYFAQYPTEQELPSAGKGSESSDTMQENSEKVSIPVASVYLNEAESQDVVNEVNQEIKDGRKDKRVKEYFDILLLRGMNFSTVRIMLIMAIIAAYQIEEEMCDWAILYYKKENTLTIRAFMSKLNELTDSDL